MWSTSEHCQLPRGELEQGTRSRCISTICFLINANPLILLHHNLRFFMSQGPSTNVGGAPKRHKMAKQQQMLQLETGMTNDRNCVVVVIGRHHSTHCAESIMFACEGPMHHFQRQFQWCKSTAKFVRQGRPTVARIPVLMPSYP